MSEDSAIPDLAGNPMNHPVMIVRDRQRSALNDESVCSLMRSIEKIGLQTPLTVRQGTQEDHGVILIAGQHRLAACRRLGHQFVECVLFEGTEIDARMWENDRDGNVLKDTNGKIRYPPIVEFASREMRTRWSNSIIEALRTAPPEAFEE
jgi:hypothetical protein